MNKLRPSLIAVLATAALGLTACANSGSDAGSTAASDEIRLVNDGKLTVCTNLAFKPFEFKDDAGNIIGYDMDLMNLVAEDLGVELEIVDIAFDQITSGSVFAAGKCDVGASGITINDERAEAAIFSQPYFDSTLALLVATDSDITSVEDLEGTEVAVQTDTTGHAWAEENAAKYGYTVRVFEDMPSASNSVLGGVTAASINDSGVLLSFAVDNTTTHVVQQLETGEQYGFNVSNDNGALAARIDQVLDAAREDGTFNDIYRTWFGVDAPAK